jgi:hypothetical protein
MSAISEIAALRAKRKTYLLKAATDHGVQQRSNTMTFNTLKIVGKNGNDRSGVKLAL